MEYAPPANPLNVVSTIERQIEHVLVVVAGDVYFVQARRGSPREDLLSRKAFGRGG